MGCRTEEDAAGMLANMSQSNAVLAAAGGQDPLAGALQADGTKGAEQVGDLRLCLPGGPQCLNSLCRHSKIQGSRLGIGHHLVAVFVWLERTDSLSTNSHRI